MSDQNKVVKFKKRKSINIGIIVFLILFLYIAINVYIYFTKEQLSIYEVHEGTTAIDNRITGLILRSEQVVASNQAGYISYFEGEGARVSKSSPIYAVDESGQINSLVSGSELAVTISDKSNAEIKHDIRGFEQTFSDSAFSSVYSFKQNAQSVVLDIVNSSVIAQGAAIAEETGITYSYNIVPSAESGILSFYTDGYEFITPDTINDDLLNPDNYQRTSLRSTGMVALNTPVYKLITSETWNIMLKLTETQYEMLQGKDRIKFSFLETDFETSAPMILKPMGSSYYAQLTLDKYLSNYLEDRFVDIELDFDSVDGLKIPLSSVVDKDFYVVPKDFFSLGAESQKLGLIKKEYEDNGEIKYPFVVTDIYYDDGAYYYIDTELFEPGQVVKSAKNNEEFVMSQTGKLKGVYNVNQGYAIFRRVEILYQNEEYCIIEKNTKNGLSAYDQIALDGSTAVNQAIIY